MIRLFSIMSKNPSGVNGASTCRASPRSSAGTKIAPAACESGVATRKRKSSGNSRSEAWTIVMYATEPNVCRTPLGRPVVPPA